MNIVENKILVITGVHGNELTPIQTGLLLKKYIKNYQHDITVLNAVNNTGIFECDRNVVHKSTSDLNRMFVSDDDVDVFAKLKHYIDDSDVIIDIHSSPNCCEFLLFNQDEYTNSYVDFAKSLDINYYIQYSESSTIKKYCIDKNKIAFTLELNKMNVIDYDSADRGFGIVSKIIDNITTFNNIKSNPIHECGIELYTHHKGIFKSKFNNGDILKPNTIIGRVLNIDTFETTNIEYTKNYSSRIICRADSDIVSSNKSIYLIQPL